MSYKIVVARFKENIDWLQTEYENCVFYTKHSPLDNPDLVQIQLPNIGREANTYFNYIIDNYHNLPDVVVFTQGDIGQHIHPRNSRDWNPGNKNIEYLIKIKDQALNHSISQNFRVHSNELVRHCWSSNFNYKDGKFVRVTRGYYKYNKSVQYKDWFFKMFNTHVRDPRNVYVGAIFAVRKDVILNKPLDFYKKMLLEVNWHAAPIQGHFLERSWYYLFTLPYSTIENGDDYNTNT
tara:strand:- start:93 stop:800 length:708 start_codon:yes stop_codon:yes gene_type:complete